MHLKVPSYFLLLATCHFLFVTGNNEIFNYLYNKYHKDGNSTGIPPLVLDVLLATQEKNSLSAGLPSENGTLLTNPVMSAITANESHSPTANFVNGTDEDVLAIQHGSGYNSRMQVNFNLIGVVIGIGIIVVLTLIGCGIALCCPWCFRREKKGIVVGGFNPNVGFQVEPQQTVVPRSSSESHLNQNPPPSYSTLPQQFSRSQNELPQFTSTQLQSSTQNLPVEPVFQHTFVQQSALNPDTHNPPYAPSASGEYE